MFSGGLKGKSPKRADVLLDLIRVCAVCNFLNMAHTEASLLKLNKEDLARIVLDFENKQDVLLNKINNDMTYLKKNYKMLESELSVSRNEPRIKKKTNS